MAYIALILFTILVPSSKSVNHRILTRFFFNRIEDYTLVLKAGYAALQEICKSKYKGDSKLSIVTATLLFFDED